MQVVELAYDPVSSPTRGTQVEKRAPMATDRGGDHVLGLKFPLQSTPSEDLLGTYISTDVST